MTDKRRRPIQSAVVTPYIRPVDRADLEPVARLERQCFHEPWPPEAFAQFVDAAGFLVAIVPEVGGLDRTTTPIDGKLAGYIVTTPAAERSHSTVHIRNLAVAPEYRRRGVARRLIRASIDRYPMEVFECARLEVRASNDAALSLYRNAGFRVRQRIPDYYADGETALVMVRSLDARVPERR